MQRSSDGTLTQTTREHIVAEMADALASQANDTGGWGNFPAKASRLEPSCWAAIALSGDERLTPARLRGFFDRTGGSGDLFVDQAGTPPNVTSNALVVLALLAEPSLSSPDRTRRLLSAITATTGLRTPPSPVIRQDNMLEGWPWIAETFSWVEPTSWSLLALKRAARAIQVPAAARRIAEAEKLLVDRCCESGGWNYGNSNVLGTNLSAYVSTTAIALLALQDRGDLPEVRKSVAYLERHAVSESSGMALSLALLCFRVYDHPASEVETALLAQWRRTRFLGNLQTLAMALSALNARPEALGNFRV